MNEPNLLKEIGISQNVSIQNIMCTKRTNENPFLNEEKFQKKHYLDMKFSSIHETRKFSFYELIWKKDYEDLNSLKFCTIIKKKHFYAKSSKFLKSDILYKRVLDNDDLKVLDVNFLTPGGSYQPPYCIQEFFKFHQNNELYNEYTNDLEMIEKQLSLYNHYSPNKSATDLVNKISNLIRFPRLDGDLSSFIESQNEVTVVIVPFLRRENNLRDLLLNLHGFLQRQRIQYRILVAEQINSNEKFNKGRLYNAAFKFVQDLYNNNEKNKSDKFFPYSRSNYNEFNHNNDRVDLKLSCIIMHDVDLIPESDLNLYKCDEAPRHLSLSIRTSNNRHDLNKGYEKSPYELLIGGVLVLKPHIYTLINGFSNEYWNWGAEDDG